MDNSQRAAQPDFVLNQPRYRGAQILLARRNFGCGSSREHAPWALADYGFRALIAPSYADIFFNNCYKNGLLPIVLPEREVDAAVRTTSRRFPDSGSTIDLERQTVATPDGALTFGFEVEPFRKHCLLERPRRDRARRCTHAGEIAAFEAKRKIEQPWLF